MGPVVATPQARCYLAPQQATRGNEAMAVRDVAGRQGVVASM